MPPLSPWLKFLDEVCTKRSPRQLSDQQCMYVQTSKIVTVVVILVCLYTRSAGVIYFAAGGLACVVSAKIVKNTIRQQRPLHGRKTTYGYVLRGASSRLSCSVDLGCLVPTRRDALSTLLPCSWGVCTTHYIPTCIRLLYLRRSWLCHGRA